MTNTMTTEQLNTTISISQQAEDHNVVVEISYLAHDQTTDGVFETLAEALRWIDEIGFEIGEYDVNHEGQSWFIHVEL